MGEKWMSAERQHGLQASDRGMPWPAPKPFLRVVRWLVVVLVIAIGISFKGEFWAGFALGSVLGLALGLPIWIRAFGSWWRGQ